MKKFLVLFLVLILVFSLSGCADTQTEGQFSLPIEGYYKTKGEIIIETDTAASPNGEVIPNAKAFAYQDGTFLGLKCHETSITLPDSVTGFGKDIDLPIQYFIWNKTAYAYQNIDRIQLGTQIDFIPIPNDNEHAFVQISNEKGPIYLNLKNGKFQFLSDDHTLNLSLENFCVSEDGKYAAVCGEKKVYLINLKNLKIDKIPLPSYDQSSYLFENSYPFCFVKNRLYINYTLASADDPKEKNTATFFYNLDTKTIEESATSFPAEGYRFNERYPYLLIKNDFDTGTLYIKNLKEDTAYSFTISPFTEISAMPSSSGRYVYAGYHTPKIAGYDDNGNPYYENNAANRKTAFIDMKESKLIDLPSKINGYDYNTFNEKRISHQEWISPTELLLSCYDGEKATLEGLLNLSDFSE